MLPLQRAVSREPLPNQIAQNPHHSVGWFFTASEKSSNWTDLKKKGARQKSPDGRWLYKIRSPSLTAHLWKHSRENREYERIDTSRPSPSRRNSRMVFGITVRSVPDATRFTATTPFATSRLEARPSAGQPSFSSSASSSASASTSSSSSRFQSPSGGSQPPSQPPRRPGNPSSSASSATETPEQRVARLRAAHLAARTARISPLDRLMARTRYLFDSVHRLAIVGLIGFTGIAGLLTLYTSVDMLRYNRQRKVEFQAAQKQMEADGLLAARLAFMQGKATPEQAAIVEAARREEALAAPTAADGDKKQDGSSFFKVPSLLGGPTPVIVGAVAGEAAGSAEVVKTTAAAPDAAPSPSPKPSTSSSWFSRMLSREEEGEAVGSSQRRLGYESLCEEDDAAGGVRDSDLVRALEDKAAVAKSAAAAALERERANQRNGGPLDRLGLEVGKDASAAVGGAKKSWWQVW